MYIMPRWMFVLPILLLAVLLGARGLLTDIYWMDEIFNIYRSTGSIFGPPDIGTMLTRVHQGASWPPLHYLISILAGELMGWTELATRWLSLLFGLLAVATTYRLGVSLQSHRLGLLAAFVLATSGFFVWYLHEARGYSLYVWLTACSGWLYWRLNTQRGGVWTRRAFALSLATLMYTHYVAIALVAGLGLYHLLVARRHSGWNGTFIQFFYAGLLFSPWMLSLLAAARNESTSDRGMEAVQVVMEMLQGFGNGLWPLLLIGIGLSVYAVRNRITVFLLFWTLTALMVALAGNVVSDYLFSIRHLIGLMVPLVLLMAVALNRLLDRSRPVALAVLMVWTVLGLYSLDRPDMLTIDIDAVPFASTMLTLDTMDTCMDGGVLVTYYAGDDEATQDLPLSYYLSLHNWTDIAAGAVRMANPLERGAGNFISEEVLARSGDYQTRVDNLTAGRSEVWLFALIPPTATLTQFDGEMRSRYPFCGQVINRNGLAAYVYSQQPYVECSAGWIRSTPLATCTQPPWTD